MAQEELRRLPEGDGSVHIGAAGLSLGGGRFELGEGFGGNGPGLEFRDGLFGLGDVEAATASLRAPSEVGISTEPSNVADTPATFSGEWPLFPDTPPSKNLDPILYDPVMTDRPSIAEMLRWKGER